MKLADISIQEEGRMNEFKILLFMSDDFMVPHCSTNICHFIETNRVNVICLPYLHPSVLVSFPVMAVVSSLTLQRDSSPQHYRPDRRTHCDLQLLWLQGHLDHNHSWTLSIRLYISLSLALSWCMLRAFGINLLLLHIYIFFLHPDANFLPGHPLSFIFGWHTCVHLLHIDAFMLAFSNVTGFWGISNYKLLLLKWKQPGKRHATPFIIIIEDQKSSVDYITE